MIEGVSYVRISKCCQFLSVRLKSKIEIQVFLDPFNFHKSRTSRLTRLTIIIFESMILAKSLSMDLRSSTVDMIHGVTNVK